MVWYNEHDAKKAAWLRELINRGLIAPGVVDERSIVDVRASDLRGFRQCHFFAGIGVWSYALRLAGFPDDREVWTASCPCQPFSAAGQRKGKADERHLWPEFARLLRECRPVLALGEQVASRDGLAWLDDVFTDLEAAAYTAGAVDTCAAGFGAPHIRQRLYWCAIDGKLGNSASHDQRRAPIAGRDRQRDEDRGSSSLGPLADDNRERRDGLAVPDGSRRDADTEAHRGSAVVELAVSAVPRLEERRDERGDGGEEHTTIERAGHAGRDTRTERQQRGWEQRLQPEGKGPVNGFWRECDWIPCSDGKARPTEPGTFPLAHGATARVVRLRGYGDAIVAPQAAAFVRAVCAEIGGL